MATRGNRVNPDNKGDLSGATDLMAFARGNYREAIAALALAYGIRNLKVEFLSPIAKLAFKDSNPGTFGAFMLSQSDQSLAELYALTETALTVQNASGGGRSKRMTGGDQLTEGVSRLLTALKNMPITVYEKLSKDTGSYFTTLANAIENERFTEQAAEKLKNAIILGGLAAGTYDLRSGTTGYIGSVVVATIRGLQFMTPKISDSLLALEGFSEILNVAVEGLGSAAPGILVSVIVATVIQQAVSEGVKSFDYQTISKVNDAARETIERLFKGKLNLTVGNVRMNIEIKDEDYVNIGGVNSVRALLDDRKAIAERGVKFGPQATHGGAKRRRRKTKKSRMSKKSRRTRRR